MIRMAVVVATALAVPSVLAGQTSLTIYNDGRVLVRRELPAKLPKGTSTQRLGLGALDPASVFALDPDVTLLRLSYDGAIDEASVLRRSVGKRVVFRIPESTDTVSALVLGVDPLRLRMPDGRVTFTPPGAALYPAEVAVADPTLTLDLESARAKDALGLGYFTGGAGWQATYQALLGPKEARVTGMAILESQALRSDSARIQLLAGSVGQAQPAAPPGRPRLPPARGRGGAAPPRPPPADADGEASPDGRLRRCHGGGAAGRRVPPLHPSRASQSPAGTNHVGRAVRTCPGGVRADLRGPGPDPVLGHPPAAGR